MLNVPVTDSCTGFGGVTSENCATVLPYSETFYPNPIFKRKRDAAISGRSLVLIKDCDPRAFPFFCGMLLPECPNASPIGLGQIPCRHFCEAIANELNCSRFFVNIDCDVLPETPIPGNPDFCTYVNAPAGKSLRW